LPYCLTSRLPKGPAGPRCALQSEGLGFFLAIVLDLGASGASAPARVPQNKTTAC